MGQTKRSAERNKDITAKTERDRTDINSSERQTRNARVSHSFSTCRNEQRFLEAGVGAAAGWARQGRLAWGHLFVALSDFTRLHRRSISGRARPRNARGSGRGGCGPTLQNVFVAEEVLGPTIGP